MKHAKTRAAACRCLLLGFLAVAGCGTNRFQQELQTEEAAVKLTDETIAGDYELLATAELKQWMDDGEDFLLVDAMPADESYDKGHLPDAVNFVFPKEVVEPLDAQQMDNLQAEAFAELLGEDKERKLVMYCGFVTCARSHNAAALARKLGYNQVYRYPGGIYAWQGAGYPLTTE